MRRRDGGQGAKWVKLEGGRGRTRAINEWRVYLLLDGLLAWP